MAGCNYGASHSFNLDLYFKTNFYREAVKMVVSCSGGKSSGGNRFASANARYSTVVFLVIKHLFSFKVHKKTTNTDGSVVGHEYGFGL